jgi:CheY-like chemotaxis protein
MGTSRVLGKRILLVEDERWVRECIKRLLWLDAHVVTEAADGVEACELFEQGEFDVVITDHDMPKMAGNALVVSIRSRAPSQPIIMITARAEALGEEHGPVNAVLSKPFGVDELRQTLATLLA